MDKALVRAELRECVAEAEWMLKQVELTKKAMNADQPWGEYAVSYAEIRIFDLRSIEALKHVFPVDSPALTSWYVHEVQEAITLDWQIRDFQSKIGVLRSAIRSIDRQIGSLAEPGNAPNSHPVPSQPAEPGTPTGASAARSGLRVFLCHSSADKPEVRRLYDRLVADGFDAWLDDVNLLAGQDWEHEISRAVKQADVFLACLSAHSVNKRGFVQKEIKFALDAAEERPEGAIFVIPVRLDDCELPGRLARWHRVDLFSDDGYARLKAALSSQARRE